MARPANPGFDQEKVRRRTSTLFPLTEGTESDPTLLQKNEFAEFARLDPEAFYDVLRRCIMEQTGALYGRIHELEKEVADEETLKGTLRATEEELKRVMQRETEKSDEVLELNAEKDRYKNALAESVAYQDSSFHRSATPGSRQASVSAEERRSVNIPDPPVLTDGKDPKFEDWVLRINDKLAANADHFPTSALRLAYVKSRCGGRAAQHLIARSRADSPNPYRDSPDILSHLRGIFEDVNGSLIARNKFRALSLRSNTPFHEFLSDFTYLAQEGRVNETEWKTELYEKLGPELQRAVIREYLDIAVNYHAFVFACSQLATGLEQIAYKESKSRGGGNSGRQRATGNVDGRTSVPSQLQGPLTDELRSKLLKEGRCFSCRERGHTSLKCPHKARTDSTASLQALETTEESSLDLSGK